MLIYIIAVTILLSSIIAVLASVYYEKRKERTILSIKEAVLLTDFPILTFNNNGKKLRFLLDTGSNRNIIDKRMIPYLMITDSSSAHGMDSAEGLGGTADFSGTYLICFNYDSLKFRAVFMAMDGCAGFDKIKEESGVEVNGILGAPFMTQYKYLIDLDKLKVKINK